MAIASIDSLHKRRSNEKAQEREALRVKEENKKRLLRTLIRHINVKGLEEAVETAIVKTMAGGKKTAWVDFDDDTLFGKGSLANYEGRYGVTNRLGPNRCTELAYRRLRRAASFNKELKAEVVHSEYETMCFGKRRRIVIKISW